jgi:hypothetical protein
MPVRIGTATSTYAALEHGIPQAQCFRHISF